MIDLRSYDWIVVNSSAGKDSQCMLDVMVEEANRQGVNLRHLVVVHADLGRAEWEGTKELAQRQAEHYGLRFEVVRHKGEDLLDYIERRGMWPSPKQRYCTSDFKRTPVSTLFTRLWSESSARHYRKVNILNCMGLRAQESPARAKRQAFQNLARQTNGRRVVDEYLPIHEWTVDEVWERIRASGVPYHRAYDLGMPRLSCAFCIFAPKAALALAGKHNLELLDTYVGMEQRMGHRFRMDVSMAEVQELVHAGNEVAAIADWKM